MKKFIVHPSIDKIRKTYETNKRFSFQQVTEEQVQQFIFSVDGCKTSPVGDIPVDMLEVTLDIHLSLITKIMICCLKMGVFKTI